MAGTVNQRCFGVHARRGRVFSVVAGVAAATLAGVVPAGAAGDAVAPVPAPAEAASPGPATEATTDSPTPDDAAADAPVPEPATATPPSVDPAEPAPAAGLAGPADEPTATAAGSGDVLAAAAVTLSERPDATWQANRRVLSIASVGNTVYLAGEFTEMLPPGATSGGTARGRLAAIDATTGALLPWNPNASSSVSEIVASPDGSTIYAVGYFSMIGGVTRRRVAAIDAATGAIREWDPNANASVRGITLSPDGTIAYLGGSFSSIGGATRRRLAAVATSTGAVVPGWDPRITHTLRPGEARVLSLRVSPDGASLFVGGVFAEVDGVAHNGAARIVRSSGAVDQAWDAGIGLKTDGTDTEVYELAVSPDGSKVFLCGDYFRIQGQASPNLAAVSPATGSKVTSWIATTDGAVNTCAVSNQALYIGGHFDNAGGANADPKGTPDPTGERRQHVAGIDIDTGDLLTWNPGANSVPGLYALATDPGHVWIGGDFSRTGHYTRQQRFAQYSGTP